MEVETSSVTIKGVTITGGTWTPTGGQTGGGVVVGSGTLKLAQCNIEGNQGNDGSGGAGINSFATTNITDCMISSNTAGGGAGQGGGIHVGGSGVVNMTGGSVQGNDAGFGGGFDIDSGGSVTLMKTHVMGNTAGSQGGGIDNNGSLTATSVSVNANNTGGQGGGIIQNGTATLTNSFVLRNSTSAPVGNGGGIYVTSGHTARALPSSQAPGCQAAPAARAARRPLVPGGSRKLQPGDPDALAGQLVVLSSLRPDSNSSGATSAATTAALPRIRADMGHPPSSRIRANARGAGVSCFFRGPSDMKHLCAKSCNDSLCYFCAQAGLCGSPATRDDGLRPERSGRARAQSPACGAA